MKRSKDAFEWRKLKKKMESNTAEKIEEWLEKLKDKNTALNL